VARSKHKWSGRTIGRDELYDAARLAAGLSGSQSKLLVGQVLEEIAATLERGETVKLSSFGSFTVQQKKERIGRNLKTGEPAPISARRTLRFKPSPALKSALNS